MDFKNYLEKSANQVDQILDQILSEFLADVKKTNIKLLPFALGLINSCKGGKRIRGVLVKMGYEIASMEDGRWKMEDGKGILRIAAAMEILHSSLLIHDDIMDQSPLRRGKPSLYKALGGPASPDERASRGGDHYGISQAINIGDIGLYLPIKIITESSFLGEYKLKALSLLSQTVINTGWGQILDIEGSEDNIEFIRIFKTAKYTIAGPMQLGAILGGLGPTSPRLRGVKEFGESLGIAFQIKDDILDGDLPAGRQGVESVDTERAKALEYATSAKKLIPKITSDTKMKNLLESMCQFIVERKK